MNAFNFSIIIPSRNRPQLVQTAVASIVEQTYPSVEIIVVNDGSSQEHGAAYSRLTQIDPDRVRSISLFPTPKGHGPCYAINRGAEVACGSYLGFLDDDDQWTDRNHLARVARTIAEAAADVDAYFSCQTAYIDGQPIAETLWLNDLGTIVEQHETASAKEPYQVSVSDLLKSPMFAHLNNTILRRDLYWQIGGMDETIRYEGEWDMYFRLIEAARTIFYDPHVVSRHNVPDQARSENVSTEISTLLKLLYRIRVMDKALLFSQDVLIRRTAHRNKMISLKRIGEHFARRGEYDQGFHYATEALIGGFNWKWLLYCTYLAIRAHLVSKSKS